MARGTNNPDPNSILVFYIINMVTGEIIKFPAYPSDLSESYSADFQSNSPMGRSAPYIYYGGNDARSFSFSVWVEANMCDDYAGTIKKLRALIYPEYRGSIVAPPYCHVRFGDMLNTKAIIESIDFSWAEDAPVLEGSNYISRCEISFTFNELRLKSIPHATGIFNEG